MSQHFNRQQLITLCPVNSCCSLFVFPIPCWCCAFTVSMLSLSFIATQSHSQIPILDWCLIGLSAFLLSFLSLTMLSNFPFSRTIQAICQTELQYLLISSICLEPEDTKLGYSGSKGHKRRRSLTLPFPRSLGKQFCSYSTYRVLGMGRCKPTHN